MNADRRERIALNIEGTLAVAPFVFFGFLFGWLVGTSGALHAAKVAGVALVLTIALYSVPRAVARRLREGGAA